MSSTAVLRPLSSELRSAEQDSSDRKKGFEKYKHAIAENAAAKFKEKKEGVDNGGILEKFSPWECYITNNVVPHVSLDGLRDLQAMALLAVVTAQAVETRGNVFHAVNKNGIRLSPVRCLMPFHHLVVTFCFLS